MKTQSVTPADIKKQWVIVDAKDQSLGRIAAEVARLLRGKHKPSFVPHLDCGDNVIVINADKVSLTGRKWDTKFYYRHSNYIGGLKATLAKDLLATYPDRLINFAVKGMLPRNKLGRKVLGNLKVYAGQEHPHEAQKPVAAPLRLAKEG
ncbi:50S ribosomal protein L13 [Pseudobacteriovorax antillogorgiicola]|uniref:Large ribosomal subunit protein uL13 n=1 Tax=Pseudobacteriovorax antillogorgiicola TaxID=1513793 RepID=A0A1Y6B7D1_9BACT|nr:50S ribosomal protein L13 [Pseudobacteriovorax antillogorgiicola]TCS59451.1 LSU ribosomal protein L13P [Pseudobacteriovorax antillogorgiicola]SME88205.1 LSU ribosomal protein L13P [Pseudobacteriovorax antillogorgiicola]